MDPLALPVQVVDLELDKPHLRVFGEDLVRQPVKAVELLVLRQQGCLNAMDEVIVKIPCAGLFELGVENLIPILQGIDEASVEFYGKGEAVSGIAVYRAAFATLSLAKPLYIQAVPK